MTDRDRIRQDYEGYVAAGRERIWDLSNPGFARLIEERDRALLDVTLGALPEQGRLLDVGCGDGRHIKAVLTRRPGTSAIGVDLLPERIEQARDSVPHATFLVASADALPVETSSVDVTLAVTLFSSLPSSTLEEAVASEINRVVRPGGVVVWFDLRRDNPWNHSVHGLAEGRLTELFPGWHRELRSFTLLPPLARRLGRSTPLTYPALHAIPPLRSHLIGRLRCPS